MVETIIFALKYNIKWQNLKKVTVRETTKAMQSR